MIRGAGALALSFLVFIGGPAIGAAPRVMSLDQCADQYVLALSPRVAIVGVSPRVDNADSYLRAQAGGLPRRRASEEAILAARPEVLVRYWGGDEALLRQAQARGVTIVSIGEATDFDGVRANVRRVAASLGQPAKGEALIARMDAQIAAAHGAWRGRDGLYLTSGGDTAGRGTLLGAIMSAAGLSNDAPAPGYASVSLERLALDPPGVLVLGFFEPADVARQSWAAGRLALIQRITAGRPAISLPAAVIGCPAWFAGDAVQALAAQAPS
jgi:iron complex transport system substrate-binding protein